MLFSIAANASGDPQTSGDARTSGDAQTPSNCSSGSPASPKASIKINTRAEFEHQLNKFKCVCSEIWVSDPGTGLMGFVSKFNIFWTTIDLETPLSKTKS